MQKCLLATSARRSALEISLAIAIDLSSEGKRMVSGLTRNQMPGNRLRVRIPCPPLLRTDMFLTR
jgi:hypothetical protein